MSEEKLDRIDQRLTELVGITGNLVTTVRELVGKVEDNTERITSLEDQQRVMSKEISMMSKQISAVTEQQKTTSAQLADVVRVVIKTDQRVEAMDSRMEEGFEELHNESRIANRKIDWATNTSLDAQKRVEDLESRVAKIEEKISI